MRMSVHKGVVQCFAATADNSLLYDLLYNLDPFYF